MAQGRPHDLSSSSEEAGTDSESDASSGEAFKKTEVASTLKKAPAAIVVGAKSGAAVTSKPLVVKSGGDLDASHSTKRTRASSEEADEPEVKKKKNAGAGKVVEEQESKKKRGAVAEKTVEEPESRKRKAGKAENGVEKAPPQKQLTKKERKGAAEKPQKDELTKEGSVQKNEKDKPKLVVGGKEAVVAEKRSGKGKKQAREAEVQNEESPTATPPQKNDVPGDTTPVKPKSASHWSFEDEMAFSQEVLSHLKPGQQVSAGKGDVWFLQLIKDVEGKLGGRFSKEQLSDKIRRMSIRYNQLADRIKDPNALRKFKSSNEEKLFNTCWKKIWGPTPVEPEKPPVKAPVDPESEEESEDEGTEEEPSAETKPPPRNSEESSDESQAEEEDDEEEEEEEVNETDHGNGDILKDSQKSSELASQDLDDHAVPKSTLGDSRGQAQATSEVAAGLQETHGTAAMDVDLDIEGEKKQADTSAASQAILSSNSAFLANLEAKLESKLLAVEQAQEKTLAILEDVKVYQTRLVSLVELLGTRVAGVSTPVLGGFGGSILGLLGGSGLSMLTSNGLANGAEHLKLQQQWRDLDTDELGCILRRIQLVQEQRKLQDEDFRNSERVKA